MTLHKGFESDVGLSLEIVDITKLEEDVSNHISEPQIFYAKTGKKPKTRKLTK